jgi:hypothetical protein
MAWSEDVTETAVLYRHRFGLQANEICANGYDSTVKDVQPLEVDRYESRL